MLTISYDHVAFPYLPVTRAPLAPDIPIIVAGAVMATGQHFNGRLFPWSHGGDKLTVSAPENSQCKDNLYHMQHIEGYGLASRHHVLAGCRIS